MLLTRPTLEEFTEAVHDTATRSVPGHWIEATWPMIGLWDDGEVMQFMSPGRLTVKWYWAHNGVRMVHVFMSY